MKIFFELGNSRLKVALVDNGHYDFVGAVDKSLIDSDQFINALGLDRLENVENIYFCSVASPEENALLIETLTKRFQCYPTELTTQPNCCGIQNGYEEFNQLGVDRWMSILGATEGSPKPVIVVSLGTAMTVDAIVEKQHLGGFIVPGLSLMRHALAMNTARLNDFDSPSEQAELTLATNTENAILGGTLYMMASYINSLIKELESETGRKFDCFGTGGDFGAMESLLDKPFTYVEDLTLKGMLKVTESF